MLHGLYSVSISYAGPLLIGRTIISTGLIVLTTSLFAVILVTYYIESVLIFLTKEAVSSAKYQVPT